ncbi:MAG: prepilin-type N-terminal cleavage/methylation domain-containing protein [Candidatus Omnitrophica bacterium]|nr:prepilin-type N-terminal cleavage/methylation domain-containing protein [Candidatus Omnitrophota bacterium]
MRAFSKIPGFTLLEIIVVIMLIGLLATVAIPNLLNHVERSKYSEGARLLSAVRDAQIAYEYENGAYANNLANLDVAVANVKNFFLPVARDTDPVAQITRLNNRYTLSIYVNGAVTCAGVDCALVGCHLGGGNQCN